MTRTFSIRELTRNNKILADYDYIDIEDKKSHRYKGVFVSSRYAEEVKEFIDSRLKTEKEEMLDSLGEFADMAHGEIGGKSIQNLKSDRIQKKNEKNLS